MLGFRQDILVIVLFLSVANTGPAVAEWYEKLELRQLFWVEVSGPRKSSEKDTNPQPFSEVGTAWAITSNMLITANHVTGDPAIFKAADQIGEFEIPQRSVTVKFPNEKDKGLAGRISPMKKGIVTLPPSEKTDAVRLTYDTKSFNPFKLSACGIVKGKDYRVLKFDGDNLFSQREVPLTWKGFGSSFLGDSSSVTLMEAFPKLIEKSDSGSPVLDEDDQVVGLVSAVTKNGGFDDIHVTLLSSFLPLIPYEVKDIECTDRNLAAKFEKLSEALAEAEARSIDNVELHRKLHTHVSILKEENVDLKVRLNKAESEIATLRHELNVTKGVSNMAVTSLADTRDLIDKLKFDGTEESRKEIKLIIGEMQEQLAVEDQHLLPSVDLIREYLNTPNMEFKPEFDGENVRWEIDFSREFVFERKNPKTVMCWKPLLPYPNNPRESQNWSKKGFYDQVDLNSFREREKNRTVAAASFRCQSASNTVTSATDDDTKFQKGKYTVTFPSYTVPEFAEAEIKSLKTAEAEDERIPDNASWTGLVYVAVFEERRRGNSRSGRLLKRYLVDLLPTKENSFKQGALPCIEFQSVDQKPYSLIEDNEASQSVKCQNPS